MNHVASPNDLATYNMRLRHSMADKVFFLERVPAEVTVFADFGCADGHLLRELHLHRREQPGGWDGVYVGYDHNPDMIAAAKRNRADGNYEFTADYAMFAARLERHHRQGRKSCLVLSSVVHEVLSQRPGGFIPFWHLLGQLGCEYIAIRDMAVEADAFHHSPGVADTEAVCRDPNMAHFLLYGVEEPGTFSHRAEFLEGLLKADYRDNWENEYAERYFPLTAEQWFLATTLPGTYQLRHFEHSPVPFLQAKWRERYGIHVPDPTHIKLILQRRPRAHQSNRPDYRRGPVPGA